jgi:N-acyl homoserine lactone hydrolase
MRHNTSRFLIAALVVALSFAALVFAALPRAAGQTEPSPPRRAQPPRSLRLYVFDCGTIHVADLSRFSLKPEEVVTTDLSVACFLVTHPKGTLIWDAGAVPDSSWKPTGAVSTQHVMLPDSQQRLALSHYHYDHTANSNQFAGATWLVRQEERDAMFAEKPPGTTQPSTYAALRNSKTMILKTDDHDVFGDGTVIIKWAPGHTPGHQVLYVKLPKTGPVLLSGDLYHYPEERALDRVPTFEFNPAQTRATRAAIDAFLKKTGAQLWIQHDFLANAKLKKSPHYYD